jgi:hypothetical protein
MDKMFGKKKNQISFSIDHEGLPILPWDIEKKFFERKKIFNYPVGSNVIIRSNENEPYSVGIITAYIPISQSKDLVPVVNIHGKEHICFSIIRHYSSALCRILDKLTPSEQWNILSEFNIREDKNEL